MQNQDSANSICNAVANANNTNTAVCIAAGNSKAFYGNKCTGNPLDVSKHTGIIDYEPSELFITARCGTPLREIETVLHEQNQMLPFEPPHFGNNATLGGAIACGLAGPRRPHTGSVRDSILGVHIVNGAGEYLRFGGQVMKNVAGYDVARLMCGALGTLGIVMQASLKVIPAPRAETTLSFELNEYEALINMNQWAQKNLPITATYFEEGILYVRITGTGATLRTVKQTLGGEQINDHESFWRSVKEQNRSFFNDSMPLWRLSLPGDTETHHFSGNQVFEWNGGLRWLKTEEPEDKIFAAACTARGNATLFDATDKPADCFQPLSPALINLHKKVKQAFDPNSILNPGKMYSWC